MPRLPDRKGGGRGSFYIQICVKTVSAELTADLHRVKVRDAVSSVDEKMYSEKGGWAVMKKSSGKVVKYNKWGYIFLIPFIVVYVIFQLIPLISTIYNSFFENYISGQKDSVRFRKIPVIKG